MVEEDGDDKSFLVEQAEEHETKDEFLEDAYYSPEDDEDGGQVPDWWDERPEEANDFGYYRWEQLDETTFEYYHNDEYHVIISKESDGQYEVHIDLGYHYRDFARRQLYVEQFGFIDDVDDGYIIVDLQTFPQHFVQEAVDDLVDQYVEVKEGREEFTEAIETFQ